MAASGVTRRTVAPVAGKSVVNRSSNKMLSLTTSRDNAWSMCASKVPFDCVSMCRAPVWASSASNSLNTCDRCSGATKNSMIVGRSLHGPATAFVPNPARSPSTLSASIRLERHMALAIAHEVTGRLTPAQETRLAHGRTANPRAYDAYLRGRYFWGQRTPEPARAAIGYFEQALREDPHFALAYSGLADCYAVSWWAKGEKDFPLAEKYARKALALDPDLAEAHASLGIIDAYRHRYADAEKELRRALDLNPNYVMAHHRSEEHTS